jgi:hypothetical protein
MFDIDKERKIHTEEVNIKTQIFLAWCPYITFLAAYRIKKLRRFAIIFSIFSFLSFLTTAYLLTDAIPFILYMTAPVNYLVVYHSLQGELLLLYLFIGIANAFPLTPVLVYYIRKESIRWNNISLLTKIQ